MTALSKNRSKSQSLTKSKRGRSFFHREIWQYFLWPTTIITLLITLFVLASQLIIRPYAVLAHITQDPPLPVETTWQTYAPFFERYQTQHLSSEFLAAMVQSLSQGRLWTIPHWNIHPESKPWNILQPKSPEFGLMAFTKEQFHLASHYCIRKHQVVTKKPWYVLGGCGTTLLKTRASGANSIELAAAWMQQQIHEKILLRERSLTSLQTQTFALITYLCGTSFGDKYLKNLHSNTKEFTGIHSCKGRHIPTITEKVRKDQNTIRAFKRSSQSLTANTG